MKEAYLYEQIADAIRQQINSGAYQPGQRLPTVRELKQAWNCTVGTAQRAYQILADEGLVVMRAGQGTQVAGSARPAPPDPLRKAALINRAERWLLEVLTSGHTPDEAEEAVRVALDRWRVVNQASAAPEKTTLRYGGSHDLAVAWMATHFEEILPGTRLTLAFSGSQGGLEALARGGVDIAGSHLLDEDSGEYNLAHMRALLPGIPAAAVTLAHRRVGLLLAPGNPLGIHALPDLAEPQVRFINRQPGSGTRVWLDSALKAAGISPAQINGYAQERATHSEVAAAVANGQADAAIGLEAAARSYGLDFIFLTRERYDLIVRAGLLNQPALLALIAWLKSPAAGEVFARLGGYEWEESGKVRTT